MRHQPHDGFRPPGVSLTLAAVLMVAAWFLFEWGRRGEGFVALGGMVCTVLATQQAVKGVCDHDKLVRHRGKRKRYEKLAKRHGGSDWATREDIDKCPSLNTRGGLFLGSHVDERGRARDCYHDEEESVLAVAPPKSGKTTGLVMTSGLANPTGNLVYFDPVGEGLATMWGALEAKGYEVRVSTPYPRRVSRLVGREVNDVGIDFFSSLSPEMTAPRMREAIQKAIGYHMRGKPSMTENEKFFFHDGKTLHAPFAAMSELREGRKPTPAGIRHQLMKGPGELSDLYQEAIDSSFLDGAYAEIGGTLSGLLQKAGEQWAGGYGVAVQAFEAFSEGSHLAEHTNSSELDPRSLKYPDRKTALFVVHTLSELMANAEFIASTLEYLMGSVVEASETRQGKLTFVIEEAGSLYCPSLPDFLLFYRKVARMLLIYQDVFGQAMKTNGKAGMQQILSGCTWKIGMGIQEADTLEMFCKLCGTRSTTNVSLSDREGHGGREAALGQGLSHTGLPLLRPDEFRTWPLDQMLVIGQNLRPLKLTKVPYYTRPEWRRIAGSSPYAPRS